MRAPTLLLAALLMTAPAEAAETLLRLSETAHVLVQPDELAASLRADATAPTSAAAQARVNALIAKALEAAKSTPGITVATGGYSVWQRREPPMLWNASQSIQLRGSDGERVLALVGTLQAQSLAVGSLSWQVSAPAARKAQSEATRAALAALRGRADEAAAVLGMKFSSFREIRLDGQRQPMPMLARAMPAPMPGAEAAPPPRAEAQEVDITATVEADAVLAAP